MVKSKVKRQRAEHMVHSRQSCQHVHAPHAHAQANMKRFFMLCRADESIAPFLPDSKRGYVFGSLGCAAAQFAIWLLPDIQVYLLESLVLRGVPADAECLFLHSQSELAVGLMQLQFLASLLLHSLIAASNVAETISQNNASVVYC